MSRKELMLASAWVGAGIMYRVYPNDREDEVMNLIPFGIHYTPLVMDMVEAAWNVALAYPEEYERGCYEDMGNFIFDHFNDNGCEFPDHEALCSWLVDNIMSEFDSESLLNSTQEAAVRKKLIEIGESFPMYSPN